MEIVNIRNLRNDADKLVDRVLAGESFTVMRRGTPVGELLPLPRPGVSATELIRRRRNLPALDPDGIRRDIDDAVKSSL